MKADLCIGDDECRLASGIPSGLISPTRFDFGCIGKNGKRGGASIRFLNLDAKDAVVLKTEVQ